MRYLSQEHMSIFRINHHFLLQEVNTDTRQQEHPEQMEPASRGALRNVCHAVQVIGRYISNCVRSKPERIYYTMLAYARTTARPTYVHVDWNQYTPPIEGKTKENLESQSIKAQKEHRIKASLVDHNFIIYCVQLCTPTKIGIRSEQWWRFIWQ
jgi:hypothetical protein